MLPLSCCCFLFVLLKALKGFVGLSQRIGRSNCMCLETVIRFENANDTKKEREREMCMTKRATKCTVFIL